MLLYRFSGLPRILRIALPLFVATTLSACGGSGGDDGPPQPPPASVTVSGKITFDRIPFKVAGKGLNPTAPVESPARQVLVEAVDDANAILATTTTDTAGDYSLQLPPNRNVKIRVKAQMTKTGAMPTWDFRVLDNTTSGALYALEGTASSTGTANGTRNLRATSGWGTTSYTGTRAAAPFAILDTVYSAKELILTASANAAFPALNLYWSTTNKPTKNLFCTNSGDIGTTFYTAGVADAGNCTQGGALLAGIYVLGDFTQGDTDEFDQNVIAHEYGHYIEDKFSRSDSIGGQHGAGDRLDLRVAFGEGWGNAYSGMVLADPVYRDSFGGISNEFGFNLETDNLVAEGWFSEFSVGEILWDIFDSVADGNDQVSLGFPPIFSVLTGAQRQTDALTSIFPFADSLRAANPTQAAGINALLSGESISVSDAFANNELNDGGVGNPDVVPIYTTNVTLNAGPVQVCTNASVGTYNKIGNRRFLRLDLAAAATVNIAATGLVGTQASPPPDPDVILWTRGVPFASEEFGTQEVLTRPLGSGTHVIELYECTHVHDPAICHPDNPVVRNRTCMSVAITGN